MYVLMKDFLKRFMLCWLIVFIYSYLFSIIKEPDALYLDPENQQQKDLKEADTAWEKTYGHMSDKEKLNGVVLEP